MRKNSFFPKLNMIANFFGLRDEKKGLLVKKIPSGFLQQEFALPEKCLEEKWIVFRKSFIFLLSFSEFEWFICLCCKILWSGVSNHRSACGENKSGEINLEKLFSLNNFGLWAEKTWTFSKTVRHGTQNPSLHVQMNIFKKNFRKQK